MKTNSVYKSLFLAMISLFFLGSCIDLDTKPAYYSDAIILSKIMDGDTVFALDAQAQSNMQISKVTFQGTALNAPIELYNISSDSTVFEYITPESGYQSQPPASGSYVFNIVLKDGTAHSETEYIGSKWLKPFTLKDFSFNTNDLLATVEWPSVQDAGYYNVRFLHNNKVVFNSRLINKEYTTVTIPQNSTEWVGNYVAKTGDTLSVVVLAILLEDSAFDVLKIQSISYSNQIDFEWGK